MTISNDEVTSRYLVDLVRTFRNYKALGDGALSQVSDDNLHTLVDRDANSIAVIVKHLAGNLRSRFSDFQVGPAKCFARSTIWPTWYAAWVARRFSASTT